MDKDIAIQVNNVSKTFRIPHEKVTSVRGAVVSGLSKLSFKGSQSSAFGAKTYEEFKALDDVSFEVKKGEFFGIIGRNGSGKSTLLKILAGIYQPDKGKVKINGRISPFLELGIGFNPELSGRDNVYLNATVLGLSKKEIDEKFDSIVKFSELERFIDQKLKNYSSGMQVRLAFSVSIHANRDILLMDEVLAVGDSNFQSKCLEEFNRYKESGKTVILVTHDITTVQRYCDRAMLIRNGEIVKIGSAEEVGNEYIEQNITDEDKRIKGGEFVCAKKEIEKKIAKITKIEFLDGNYKEKSVFETGKFMRIRIRIRCNENIDNFVLGITILDDKGLVIYGTNNYKRNNKFISGKEKQEGYFDFIFKKITLIEGRYKVNAAIGENNKIVVDQYVEDVYFKINKGLLEDYGVVNLNPDVETNFKLY